MLLCPTGRNLFAFASVLSGHEYFPRGGDFLLLGLSYFFCHLGLLHIALGDSVFHLNLLFYQTSDDITPVGRGGNASLLSPAGGR